MTDLVVIPCSDYKLPGTHPASRLYLGPFFRLCYRAARAMEPTHGTLILSAKHGLLRPTDTTTSYDLRMGQPGSITPEDLTTQAQALGVAHHQDVTLLLAGDYLTTATQVWPHAHTPFRHTRGIGDMRSTLAGIIRDQQEALL